MGDGGSFGLRAEEDFIGMIDMDRTGIDFDRYLSAVFSRKRDMNASDIFYNGNYCRYLPQDRSAPILDIGCGTGEFLKYLISRGYSNVSGVDVSKEMVEHCKKCGISNVVRAEDTATYLYGNAGKFDLVTMNDVIEHMPKRDALTILKAIRSSLKDGGVLLLRTGNCSTLGGIYLRYKDFTHQEGYTELSLQQLILMAGFEDVVIMGNKGHTNFKNPLSIMRTAFLAVWFFVLKIIYKIELGYDRPKIYSKLLVAVCRN